MPSPEIIIATRESRLALWQAEHVQQQMAGLYPHAAFSLLGMTTTGDRILDRTLSAVGGKGLFVKELELAMLEGRAHMAVHSMKDVPMDRPAELVLRVAGKREDPRDAFVSVDYENLASLPSGAIVGTASLRRECQIRARYPQLQIRPLRGNLDTRLRKLDSGEYQAIILAAAGLRRLGLAHRIRSLISTEESLPAVGQGALGLEYHRDHPQLGAWIDTMVDPATEACVFAERTVSRRLAGSCDVPLGAFAEASDHILTLRAFVGNPAGTRLLQVQQSGPLSQPVALGEQVAQALLAQGAAEILSACRG
ncbi:MAG: hydroxymethylbilane synthase [Ferrovum sp.]|nr:hydroxymethylbilane synthase [Ferrovum sp.]